MCPILDSNRTSHQASQIAMSGIQTYNGYLYSSMQFEKFSFKFFRIKLMKTYCFSLCAWELQNQKPRYFFRSFSLT